MNDNSQPTSLVMSIFNTIYGWFVEHGYRPYITIVNMSAEGLVVPKAYANDQQLTVSIDPAAVTHFFVTEFGLEFQGRFNGKVERLYVPWNSFLLSSPDYRSVPIPMGAFGGEAVVSTATKPQAAPVKTKPKLTIVE